MKYIFFILTFSFIISIPPIAGNIAFGQNEFVTVDVRLAQSKLKAGGNGKIIISLKPKKGIHININPPMDFRLSGNAVGTLNGTLDFSTIKKDTAHYLDPSKPLTQSLTLSKSIKPGPVSLHGTFIYFYCSDAEGWCSRFKLPIDLTVTVIP